MQSRASSLAAQPVTLALALALAAAAAGIEKLKRRRRAQSAAAAAAVCAPPCALTVNPATAAPQAQLDSDTGISNHEAQFGFGCNFF